MTLRQTLQSAPARTNELIDKLSNTSNQAIKTRETLFRDLDDQLSSYVQIEEAHLIPLLRKGSDTRQLATETLKGNNELRALLSELEKTPKDDDAFIARLAELKNGFQQHVRDERKELLPAVLKALSDEEAAELADTIEGGFADAEDAKHEIRREEVRQAKHEAEVIELIAETERAARRAAKAAARDAAKAVTKAADTVRRGSNSVQKAVRQMGSTVSGKAQEAVSAGKDVMAVYQGSAQTTIHDVWAVTASRIASVQALSEVGAAVLDWASTSARTSVEATLQLQGARTLGQFAETQAKFASNIMRNWMDGRKQVLGIIHRASTQALRPLDDRLSTNA